MTASVTEESFLRDVREHRMTVLHDSGLYRHVRFAKPGTCVMQFDIVTWPGYLSFSGDMGSYVFSRLRDMFEFFRGSTVGPIEVNLGYWAEKCQAVDRDSGVREYSPERFREQVEQWLENAEASGECRAAVRSEVLIHADEGEFVARQAAGDFEFDDGFAFTDFWEANCSEWTTRYVWCCYALSWAVRQYDVARAVAA